MRQQIRKAAKLIAVVFLCLMFFFASIKNSVAFGAYQARPLPANAGEGAQAAAVPAVAAVGAAVVGAVLVGAFVVGFVDGYNAVPGSSSNGKNQTLDPGSLSYNSSDFSHFN